MGILRLLEPVSRPRGMTVSAYGHLTGTDRWLRVSSEQSTADLGARLGGRDLLSVKDTRPESGGLVTVVPIEYRTYVKIASVGLSSDEHEECVESVPLLQQSVFDYQDEPGVARAFSEADMGQFLEAADVQVMTNEHHHSDRPFQTHPLLTAERTDMTFLALGDATINPLQRAALNVLAPAVISFSDGRPAVVTDHHGMTQVMWHQRGCFVNLIGYDGFDRVVGHAERIVERLRTI